MGELICTYIYTTFLVLKTIFEIVLTLAQILLDFIENVTLAIINAVNTTITGIILVVKNIISTASATIELSEGLKGKICGNLFRCSAFLEDLINPNGPFSGAIKAVIKNTKGTDAANIASEFQQEVYKIIQDFKTFSDTICNSGFTFNFATDAIDSLLSKAKKQIDYCKKWITNKIKYVKRQIQKYIQYVIDLGIFDYLDQLKSFFNCVLDDSEICTSIETVHSFYNDSLNKLKLVPCSTGYKIDEDFQEYLLGSLNAASHTTREIELQLNSLLIETSNACTESFKAGGFDVFKNIIPGGMSFTDLKKGNFKKLKLVKYVSARIDAINEAIYGTDETDETSSYYGIDNVLRDITIDNDTGTIYYQNEKLELNPNDITITEANKEFNLNLNCEFSDFINKPIIDENGNITSILQKIDEANEDKFDLSEWEIAYNKRVAKKEDEFAVRMS